MKEGVEECDNGASDIILSTTGLPGTNGTLGDICSDECTEIGCGDGIKQEWLGEECDILDADGNIDITQGCKPDCSLTECADDPIDNDGDGAVDGNDGGCTNIMCNLASGHNKADDNEDNECARGLRPAGQTSSYMYSVPQGGECEFSNDCAGFTSDGPIRCNSQGSCIDFRLLNSGLPSGNSLTAQAAGAGGFNPPICDPNGCGGQVMGNANDCPGGEDMATCDEQRARQACLRQSAINRNMCNPAVGGVLVATPAGMNWSCSQGQGAAQQWMCGPAGVWKCVCPNDPRPPLWQENLQACPANCGNGRREQGELCDDGNRVNGDACDNACQPNNNGQCDNVHACDDPVAQAMCDAEGKVCQEDAAGVPCMKCVEEVVGVCDGTECTNGGDEFCGVTDEDCSLTDEEPCVACIPDNSCGNGEINPEEPSTSDEGCEITGTAGQFCMPEGMIPEDFGQFQPSHQCYQQGAHCQNTNGQCDWEMTPELSQCLEENGAAPAQVFGQARPSVLAAQVGGAQCDDPSYCTTDVAGCCDGQGNTVGIAQHDHCNNCAWVCDVGSREACNTFAAAEMCVQRGCNGELCVPAGEPSAPGICGAVSPAAACYALGTCTMTASGCGFTNRAAIDQCLVDNAGDTPCASSESCLDSGACTAGGGTAGVACGANDTKVCCSGGENQPQGPVEQCDDGNRVDDDECGNDCEMNCKKNADCKGGAACVNGECVDQCVAPDDGVVPPAAGCQSDFPLCGESSGDNIQGVDSIHCPLGQHAEFGPHGCGEQDAGTCYRCASSGVAESCPSTYPLCGTGNGNQGAPAASCPNGQVVQFLEGDGAVLCDQGQGLGRCFKCVPAAQGSLPGSFLMRLMAQQVPGRFTLLP